MVKGLNVSKALKRRPGPDWYLAAIRVNLPSSKKGTQVAKGGNNSRSTFESLRKGEWKDHTHASIKERKIG